MSGLFNKITKALDNIKITDEDNKVLNCANCGRKRQNSLEGCMDRVKDEWTCNFMCFHTLREIARIANKNN